MEGSPLLSIIVPVYKVEAFLPGCLDSILGQTFRDFELILVDDGSPDRCGEICEEYAGKDSRIRVIHKKNGGLSSARNAGIEVARGAWLGFVDSDDTIAPNCYETLLACARRNQVKLVCAGRYDVSFPGWERTPGLCPEREEVISGVELAKRIFTWNHVDSAAWDKLYARELFAEIRYPVGRVNEDMPVTYRIAMLAEKAALCPERVYCYVHRQGSITYSAISDKSFHYSENAEEILQTCRTDYPELVPEARYLYAQSQAYNLKILDMASKDDRKRYADRERDSRRKLRELLPFLLRCPYESGRQKLDALLHVTNLYTPMRRLWRLCRKRT